METAKTMAKAVTMPTLTHEVARPAAAPLDVVLVGALPVDDPEGLDVPVLLPPFPFLLFPTISSAMGYDYVFGKRTE